QILWYPGGYSETEILFPYGGCCFSSIVGQLAGNHFLTIEGGAAHLRELGELTLWPGAQHVGVTLAQSSGRRAGHTGAAKRKGWICHRRGTPARRWPRVWSWLPV